LVSWLSQYREEVVIAVASAAVLIPLLVGVALRQVPRQALLAWALPLTAGTLILAITIRLIAYSPDPRLRLVLSFLFGLLWLVAGVTTLIRRFSENAGAERMSRAFGWMFVLFGLAWISVAVYRYTN